MMILIAALAAAAVAPVGPGGPVTEPRFQTGCVIVDARTVEGFLTNVSQDQIRVAGPIRFSFVLSNSMSRPQVQVQSSVLAPPGMTVSVGRAQLMGDVLPSETCQLDVSDAVR
jgi:hypothetical protein